jgi:hypothetical protein
MSRFEDRFHKLRQTADSPIAYAGVGPELLSQLSVSVAKEVVEAMVRTRARYSHSDVVEGREEEIRALSPYFALLKDTTQFEQARQTFIAERRGALEESKTAIDLVQQARRAEQQSRERFRREIASPQGSEIEIRDHVCASSPLSSGKWEFDILTPAGKRELYESSSRKRVTTRLDPSDVRRFTEIPEEDRDWALIEASENLRDQLLEHRECYAIEQMERKHPEITRRAESDHASPSDVHTYNHLCARFASNAPLSKELKESLKAEAVRVYQSAGQARNAQGEDRGQPAPYRELRRDVIKKYLTTAHSTDGVLDEKLGGRTILGVLCASELVYPNGKTPAAALGARADSGRGMLASEFRPAISLLLRNMPVGLISPKHPDREPEDYLLISTSEDDAGVMRVWQEGRIFSARQIETSSKS